MAAKLNCSKSKMQTWLAKHNLKPPRKLGIAMRTAKNKLRVSFTPAEDKIIKRDYLKVPMKRLSIILGRSGETALRRRLDQLGLIIPRKIINQRIKDSRLKKGNIPPNKGKKMAEYCSRQRIKQFKKTSFKKGNKPVNTLYDGVIRVRHNHKDRGCKAYKWIRIREGYWEQLHVHNWKKKYGEVPAGSIIVFRNGDTMNCSVRNLKCITRQQHCENTRNSDGWIAMSMSHDKGGRGLINQDMKKALLQNKEIIDFKRTQLELKRIIKNKENERKQ